MIVGSVIQQYYLRRLQHFQRFSPEKLRRYQWTQIARLLSYAYHWVPYYRERFNDIGLKVTQLSGFEEFTERVPLLTRDAIMENRLAMGTNHPFFRRHLVEKSTGGSSGTPVVLYQDKRYQWISAAATMRFRLWYGYRPGDRCLQLWGAPRDINQCGSIRNGKLILNAFYLDDDVLAQYAEIFREFRPRFLIGYVSSLERFAHFLEETGTEIPSVEAIESAAEVLLPQQRELFERVFCGKVFNFYGSRDCGTISCECKQHNGMHIFEDIQWLECVHQNRYDDPNLGEIAVTKFTNYGTPLIRYLNGDLGEITDTPCSCGLNFRRLSRMEGRTSDIIFSPEGRALSGLIFVHAFALAPPRGVQHYQFVQQSRTNYILKVVPNAKFYNEELGKVLAYYRSFLGDKAQIKVEKVEALEKTSTGKHKFIVSLLKP